MKTSEASALAAIRSSFQSHNDMKDDGIDHAILHGGGLHESADITCTFNGATNVNVFTVQGAIYVTEIYTRCSAEREAPNTLFDDVSFDILDSNAGTCDITLSGAGGTTCNGILKRSQIAKTGAVTAAAEFTNSDQCRVVDAGLANLFSPFKIIPYGVDGKSTVRFNYTGNATTDLDLTIHIRYIPLSGATVTAI